MLEEVLWVICPGGQLSLEEIVRVQLSGGNFLGGNWTGDNCPGDNCLEGNCPGGNCLGGNFPGVNCPVPTKDSSLTIYQRNLKLLVTEMFDVKIGCAPDIMKEIFETENRDKLFLLYQFISIELSTGVFQILIKKFQTVLKT